MDVDQELRVAQATQQQGRLTKEQLLLMAGAEEGDFPHGMLVLLVKGVDHTRVPVEIEELWHITQDALGGLEAVMRKAHGMLTAQAGCDLG